MIIVKLNDREADAIYSALMLWEGRGFRSSKGYKIKEGEIANIQKKLHKVI